MRNFSIITTSVILLLLTSTFVFAAGTSTVPTTTDTTTNTEDTTTQDKPVPTNDGRTFRETQIESVKDRLIKARTTIIEAADSNTCEDLEDRAERIACRLKRYKTNPEYEGSVDYEKRVPEACRSGRNPTACIALYKRVNNNGCYSLDGKNKDKCFKNAINVTKAKLRDLPQQERREKARDYLVLLLYELQERIEHANENGNIQDEDAAEIINLIVEIKQDILDKKPKTDIIPKLNDLKQKIRAFRSGQDTE